MVDGGVDGREQRRSQLDVERECYRLSSENRVLQRRVDELTKERDELQKQPAVSETGAVASVMGVGDFGYTFSRPEVLASLRETLPESEFALIEHAVDAASTTATPSPLEVDRNSTWLPQTSTDVELAKLRALVDVQAEALREMETMFAAVVASCEGHTVLVDKTLLERVERLERFTHPITGTPVFRAVLGRVDGPGCEHDWIDIRNERVESGEMCRKCGALRAGNEAGRVDGGQDNLGSGAAARGGGES